MTRETWFGHVIGSKHGNRKYFLNKENAIKNSISNITSFLQYSDSPKNEWFADYNCLDFRPFYLRIAFREIEKDVVIVTTLYLTPKGVLNYEP